MSRGCCKDMLLYLCWKKGLLEYRRTSLCFDLLLQASSALLKLCFLGCCLLCLLKPIIVLCKALSKGLFLFFPLLVLLPELLLVLQDLGDESFALCIPDPNFD